MKIHNQVHSNELSHNSSIPSNNIPFHRSFIFEKRTLDTFNEMKASLLKKIYGSNWYHQSLPLTNLPSNQYREFIKCEKKRKMIRHNAMYWSQHSADKLSCIQWHIILQNCVDFNLPEEWSIVMKRCLDSNKNWSNDEKSLFWLTW